MNFASAVAEAFFQEIPLLILTADRPKEWIGQMDGQAIYQENIFAKNICKSYSLQMGDLHPDNDWYINRVINEAIFKSKSNICSPVHINFGFREPFYPNPEDITNSKSEKIIIRYNSHKVINKDIWEDLVTLLLSYNKILIVVGQMQPNIKFKEQFEKFISESNIPVLADINSNIQYLSNSILHSDLIVNNIDNKRINELKPEILITFGNQIVSKNIKNYLKNNKPKIHIHIHENDEIIDTFQTVTHILNILLETFVLEIVNQVRIKGDKKYLETWKKKDKITKKAIEEYTEIEPNSEFSIIYNITNYVPKNSIIHTANSLSVRYLNMISSAYTLNYCNRGTSGIDGCTSTAIGSAMVSTEITTLITGDVAFFYDRNAFWHNYVPSNLRIIILNNQGGAIFGHVEGSKIQPELEEYFIGKNQLTAKNICNENNIIYINLLPNQLNKEVINKFYENSSKPKIMEITTNGSETSENMITLKKIIKKYLDVS